jgi:hypothetical protein
MAWRRRVGRLMQSGGEVECPHDAADAVKWVDEVVGLDADRARCRLRMLRVRIAVARRCAQRQGSGSATAPQ